MSSHSKQAPPLASKPPVLDQVSAAPPAAPLRLSPVDPRKLAIQTLRTAAHTGRLASSLPGAGIHTEPAGASPGLHAAETAPVIPRVHRIQRELRRRPAGNNEFLDIRITWLLDGSPAPFTPAFGGGHMTLN